MALHNKQHYPYTRHCQESNRKREKRQKQRTTERHPEDTAETQHRLMWPASLAGKDRCPEIAAASASGVPGPAYCDITCLPPHNHDESLWAGRRPLTSPNNEWQWQTPAHHAFSLPLFIFPLFLSWSPHFFHYFPYLRLSLSHQHLVCLLSLSPVPSPHCLFFSGPPLLAWSDYFLSFVFSLMHPLSSIFSFRFNEGRR